MGLERATDEEAQESALHVGRPHWQQELVQDAVRPLAESPELRNRMLSIRCTYDRPHTAGR